MISINKNIQSEILITTMEEIVPEDSLFRKVDKYIDFTFIYEEVKDLYCEDNGRPSIDPVILFKLVFIQALDGIKSESIEDIVVAYEPIWAIGTGKTASSSDAEDMIAFIRETIKALYGELSEKVRIQYGGSVKPSNIAELMEKKEIDGALVGGASLKAEDFSKLVNF